MILDVERVKFKRPNSDKIEVGLLIGEFGRHIIVDDCLNVVINCSLESYANDSKSFELSEKAFSKISAL